MADGTTHCACGHPRAAHQHYRAGSDCAHCGCPRFRRGGGWWRRLLGGR